MKQSPRARRWRKRVLATGLWLAGTIAVLVVATACRCEPPSTEQVAPSPLPSSDHWHPERKAPCVQVSNADGEALAECAYALEPQDLKLCGKCCPERSGCDPFLEYDEAARNCDSVCLARQSCKTSTQDADCVHCLACCKSHRCKYGFGEYAGALLSFKNVRLSLVHPYPACPIIGHLDRPLPPCVPPIDGPACQGMKRATVGLTLADGTFVPLLTGKNEREVRCEGPW